jgi:hypothetical protein
LSAFAPLGTPRRCIHGATTTIAKKPYATDGMAARISITDLTISRARAPSMSLTAAAAQTPSGMATRLDSTVTYSVPVKIGSAPKSGGVAAGCHCVPRKNPRKPSALKKGTASRMMKKKMKATATIEAEATPASANAPIRATSHWRNCAEGERSRGGACVSI